MKQGVLVVEEQDIISTEKVYWSNEIAEHLNIQTSTLRKWCLILEEKGYDFHRNENDRRGFFEFDLNALTEFKKLTKKKNISLEHAAQIIVEKFKKEPNQETKSSAVGFGSPSKKLEEKIDELTEHVKRQDEFNRELLNRLIQQQDFIDKSMKERDKMLIDAIRDLQETKKLESATVEEEQKKSFWNRLFKN
jgi:transposase